MDYKLTKELKNSGFPLTEIDESREIVTGKTQIYTANRIDGKDYYEPTLSKLIEECGDDFNVIFKDYYGSNWACGTRFYEDLDDYKPNSRGKTPEEAIAHLYIALNKKK